MVTVNSLRELAQPIKKYPVSVEPEWLLPRSHEPSFDSVLKGLEFSPYA
jgi:hypothetical protein